MDNLLAFLLDKSSSMADEMWIDRYAPVTPPPEVEAIREAHRQMGRDPDTGILRRTPIGSSQAYGTMKAFNHFLQVMQYREDDCAFYMAEFAQICQTRIDFGNLFDAAPLDLDWRANGSDTNLWGSIIDVIQTIDAKINSLPTDERPKNVTLVIQTDGEDSSHAGIAQRLVAAKLAEGWDIIFLACGSTSAPSRLGLDDARIIRYRSDAVGGAFDDAANLVIEHLVTGTKPEEV